MEKIKIKINDKKYNVLVAQTENNTDIWLED